MANFKTDKKPSVERCFYDDDPRLIPWAVIKHPELKEEILEEAVLDFKAYKAAFPEATPLLVTIKTERIDIMRCLVREGVDVNAGSLEGLFPLAMACCSRYVCSVELLLKAGADINKRDENGLSVMFHAVQHARSLCVVYTLIKGGFKIDTASCIQCRLTPIIHSKHTSSP